MPNTLILRLVIDNERYELEIPRPTTKQRICDLGEPWVNGVWGALVENAGNQPKWENDGASEK